jgi:RimJ/RimL family protein N-acetyltransferase
MTEAAKRAIAFAFQDLELNRINVKAAVDNIASNKTIRKLGFVFEGTQKQAMRSRANGFVYDMHMYGLLREDWDSARQRKE